MQVRIKCESNTNARHDEKPLWDGMRHDAYLNIK
jgi:hypothetical protein